LRRCAAPARSSINLPKNEANELEEPPGVVAGPWSFPYFLILFGERHAGDAMVQLYACV
jgi:hypothetical protein